MTLHLMASMRTRHGVLRSSEESAARAMGALLLAAAALVVISLALPHPSGNTSVMIAIAAAMAIIGLFCSGFASRIPIAGAHSVLAGTTALTGLLIYESGVAAGQYGAIFVWSMLIASYYFPRKVAAVHLCWLLYVYALTLAAVESTVGFSPLTRWLFTAISLVVVSALTSTIVAGRMRADLKGRRFFDLSHDLLCTANEEGYFVELNAAWKRCLGYSEVELRALPFLKLVHPEDRQRTEAQAIGLFEGAETLNFENRFLAKDGTWHWLRWSSTLAPDESLIYARATDVTELKRVESERERLLSEVQQLARSDALTGLR